MKRFIIPGMLFVFTGIACLVAVVIVLIMNQPTQEERLLQKYESAIKASSLERVLQLNGIEKQGIIKKYKEEDIPYLGMKPEFIIGSRKSGNEGEKGILEYVVLYQEDGELKYEIRRDQVIKSEGEMYILNW